MVHGEKNYSKLADGVWGKRVLHAKDESYYPNDRNCFLSINWSPETAAAKTYRFVLAENQKTVRTAICD